MPVVIYEGRWRLGAIDGSQELLGDESRFDFVDLLASDVTEGGAGSRDGSSAPEEAAADSQVGESGNA